MGDGPNNRYALICRGCHSHNGMALRDEFEYMTFRCAYCYHVNLAPKTRPVLQPSSASSSKLANKNGQGGAGRRGSERRDSGDGAKGRPTIEGVSPHAQVWLLGWHVFLYKAHYVCRRKLEWNLNLMTSYQVLQHRDPLPT